MGLSFLSQQRYCKAYAFWVFTSSVSSCPLSVPSPHPNVLSPLPLPSLSPPASASPSATADPSSPPLLLSPSASCPFSGSPAPSDLTSLRMTVLVPPAAPIVPVSDLAEGVMQGGCGARQEGVQGTWKTALVLVRGRPCLAMGMTETGCAHSGDTLGAAWISASTDHQPLLRPPMPHASEHHLYFGNP